MDYYYLYKIFKLFNVYWKLKYFKYTNVINYVKKNYELKYSVKIHKKTFIIIILQIIH